MTIIASYFPLYWQIAAANSVTRLPLTKTHELIRRILPKGTSFDSLQQEDIDLMLSHINSYKRDKLNNRSAYQLFSFIYGESILNKLNERELQPNDIVLSPK